MAYKDFWIDEFDGGKRAITPESLEQFGEHVLGQAPGVAAGTAAGVSVDPPVHGQNTVQSVLEDHEERLGAAQSGSSDGVSFVATDADLPETATGHPVILVLEDSGALDDEGNPQATLRYWSGSDWRLLGLAGGGAVSSDFIDVELVGSLLTGQVLVWNADASNFIAGELVPE